MIEELEGRLDSFNPSERKETLHLLWERAERGEISLPQAGTRVNLHLPIVVGTEMNSPGQKFVDSLDAEE
ncbi:hypothetical protein LR007_01540 [candidate division NPL-UPA2 bacterium]|nr:hypothetical protein [candidate division NPL-UPA2 bacterium]